MLDIHGDEITLRGQTVARVVARSGTLLDELQQIIICGPEGYVTENDHLQLVDEAREEAREVGELAGRQAAKEELEDARENIENAAYADGRADGIAASGNANQINRVACLLAALERIHDMLLAVVDGVKDQPDHYIKRPPKISELKPAMRRAITAARIARNEYERPNGET